MHDLDFIGQDILKTSWKGSVWLGDALVYAVCGG